MTFLVLDTASNNVLDAFDSYAEAETFRIQTIGHNPPLAEYVEVVDVARLVAQRREAANAAAAESVA